MQETYQPHEIERLAQQQWEADDAYRVNEQATNPDGSPKPKYYACSMLPYPSGKLHMGHVRNYTINDVMTRYLRLSGYNVLMPMGWDAFGMPAENAALSSKVPPAQWTYENIAYMKKQMKAMGLAIDWSREVNACDPEYYKWNQWFFLRMLKAGIAYRKTQVVNWDPVDQTVLANEQVIDGRGWRSGALVEKREIPGYYLAITRYADELLEGVKNDLDGWPERVRTMQAHWIGKSHGLRFAFTHDIRDETGQLIQDGRLYVFTTRADTIMGVTFCAVAPEHPLAEHAARSNNELAEFIAASKRGGQSEADIATREKEGMPTGLTVTHPITQEEIPVWVGNYVLMSYGDGAVMGVPAHDERDFEFALKYELPIQQVISVNEQQFSTTRWADWYANENEGVLIHSGPYDGLSCPEARERISADLQAKGLGEKKTTYRLRDWGISRQRYWGTPIPIIHCPECGPVPVPEEDLPVLLPEHLIPDGSGNPLTQDQDFLNCQCPECGQDAQRETDTMDTFVDSSWYFMRYTCPDNPDAMVDERNDYWMPMDQYIGGIEHAVLHLLYARFWTKVMRDMGLVSFDEPFTRLLTQGMVLNHIYSRRNERGGIEYFAPSEVKNTYDEHGNIIGAYLKSDGSEVQYEGIGTMSKSKNNGVDPQAIIDQMGADTARLFTMFASPPEQTLEWSSTGMEGAHRFLRRLWAFAFKQREQIQAGTSLAIQDYEDLDDSIKEMRREIHALLKQADYDYHRIQYNTVVSGAMKMLNTLEDAKLDNSEAAQAALAECMSILLRVLYPIVPHICWSLWNQLNYNERHGDLLDTSWPVVDEQALIAEEIQLTLQVNGRVRGHIIVAHDADKELIEQTAAEHEAVARHLEGRTPKRIIVVPGRLVNVVG